MTDLSISMQEWSIKQFAENSAPFDETAKKGLADAKIGRFGGRRIVVKGFEGTISVYEFHRAFKLKLDQEKEKMTNEDCVQARLVNDHLNNLNFRATQALGNSRFWPYICTLIKQLFCGKTIEIIQIRDEIDRLIDLRIIQVWKPAQHSPAAPASPSPTPTQPPPVARPIIPAENSRLLDTIPRSSGSPRAPVSPPSPLSPPRVVEFVDRVNTKLKTVLRKPKPEGYYLSHHEVQSRFGHALGCARQTAIKTAPAGNYIHANRIGGQALGKRTFVVAQYPSEKGIGDFWQAFYNSKSPHLIVDLTTKQELRKSYYPGNGQETIYTTSSGSKMKVRHAETIGRFVQYTLQEVGSPRHNIFYRYEYPQWNSHSSIPLDQLIRIIEDLKKYSLSEVWVHCMSSGNRTGTLITAIYLRELILSCKITADNIEDKLVELIANICDQRSDVLAPSKQQLGLLREYAEHLLKHKLS